MFLNIFYQCHSRHHTPPIAYGVVLLPLYIKIYISEKQKQHNFNTFVLTFEKLFLMSIILNFRFRRLRALA